MSKLDTSLTNTDLAPTTPAQRTWGTYNYIALWFAMSMEVSTYMLSSLAHRRRHELEASHRHHSTGQPHRPHSDDPERSRRRKERHPFPVFVRASFGSRGANLPALLRALVACGWFGIQSWIGGQAIAAMVHVLWPATASMPWVLWDCRLGFWLLNMAVVWRGVESIRFLQSFSRAASCLSSSLSLLIWMVNKARRLLARCSPRQAGSKATGGFLYFFFPSLTAIGRILGDALT